MFEFTDPERALISIPACPELIPSMIGSGALNDLSLSHLLREAIRNNDPKLVALIVKTTSLPLNKLVHIYSSVVLYIRETVPEDYRAPSILSLTDLLAEDYHLFAPLRELFYNRSISPEIPLVRWNQDFLSLSRLIPWIPNSEELNRAIARAIAFDIVTATERPEDYLKYLDIFSNPFGGVYRDIVARAIETGRPQEGPLKEVTMAILKDGMLLAKVKWALQYVVYSK
jgi:transglutaminase-like putative cysteine protease